MSRAYQTGALAALFVAGLVGQGTDPYKLIVREERRDVHGVDTALSLLEVQNTSSKQFLGIVIVTRYGAAGTRGPATVHTIIGADGEGNPKPLHPGDTWKVGPRRLMNDASGNRYPMTDRVDLIVFADGTVWGERRTAESTIVLDQIRSLGFPVSIPDEDAHENPK